MTESGRTPADPASFGRVDSDGTVYVRTAEGERSVGQVPDVPADEALAFFTRRFEALDLEVGLLQTRIASGALSPDDALASVRTVRTAVVGANAVGDLDGLVRRLDGLLPVIAAQRAARRAERTRQNEEIRAAKERFVLEAERLAAGNDWRGGVNRFRALLDQWKALPRLDRATDDELWHRFSSARTAYTRRRKAQFARENEAREAARVTKEQLAAEAEALATSTDWGPTTGAFRDLMARWKAAGPAPRGVEDSLWKRFRGAQDTFFAAKQAALSAQDSEFRANAEAKEELLTEAEALLPVRDPGAARAAYRDILRRWSVNRQGAPGCDPAAGYSASGRGDRHQRGGGRTVAPDQPGDPGPGRGHRGETGGADRRSGAASGQSRGARRPSCGPRSRPVGRHLPGVAGPGSASGQRLRRLRDVTATSCRLRLAWAHSEGGAHDPADQAEPRQPADRRSGHARHRGLRGAGRPSPSARSCCPRPRCRPRS